MEGSIISQPLVILRYAYPLLTLLYFTIASIIALCLPPSDIYLLQRKDTVYRLFSLVILCFSLDGAVGVAGIIFWHLWPSQGDVIGLASCIFTFSIIAQSYRRTSNVVTQYRFHGASAIGFFCDIFTAILQCISSQDTHTVHQSRILLLFHASLAYIRCAFFGIILSVFLWPNHRNNRRSTSEEAPLLQSPGLSLSSARADAATTSARDPGSQNDWVLRFQKLGILYSYMWPQKDYGVQIWIGLIGLCLLANNWISLLIFRQYGILIDCISTSSWEDLELNAAIYLALRFLGSEAGIQLVRKRSWRRVEQYWAKNIQTGLFSHIMSLSADFHDSKDLTELNMVMWSGDGISRMVEVVCFQALPITIDLFIAIIYISKTFGRYEGLILFTTAVAFITFSFYTITSARDQQRQAWKRRSDEMKSQSLGFSLWPTVVSFNQIEHTISSYSKALESRLLASKEADKSHDNSSVIRILISLVGLLPSFWVVKYRIHSGKATAGDCVLLISYWDRVIMPLDFFATLGRNINQQLTDLEQLVDILHRSPSTADTAGAQPLRLISGEVEFHGVTFGYTPRRRVLEKFDFCVKAGQSVALVGTSGGGKSTVLSLLTRQYLPEEGYISIDGQDIRHVTQHSMWSNIGIVPQTPQIFQGTILENILYARRDASDQEVYDACKAAAIHDQIITFPDGYKTCVGGSNTKLSAGQIQRIAIARVFLMNPQIVLLDEATSSVDTDTEHEIQKALDSLCKSRTTFTIAHRLSTVMKSDMIYVMSEGKIIEKGIHQDLILQQGKYTSLWSKQTSVEGIVG